MEQCDTLTGETLDDKSTTTDGGTGIHRTDPGRLRNGTGGDRNVTHDIKSTTHVVATGGQQNVAICDVAFNLTAKQLTVLTRSSTPRDSDLELLCVSQW